MTHDSIGLGEDGPTHQPVEHLASLRAMPNLNVFRPADAIETAECWELALAAAHTPVDPGADAPGGAGRAPQDGAARTCPPRAPMCWPQAPSGAPRRHALRHRLRGRRRHGGARAAWPRTAFEAAVVSMPCWELFAAQPVAYRTDGAGRRAARCRRGGRRARAGSAASASGGVFVGMNGFGASAPASQAVRALRHHARQGCRRRRGSC